MSPAAPHLTGRCPVAPTSRASTDRSSTSFAEDLSEPAFQSIGVLEILGAAGVLLPWALDFVPVLTPLAAAGLAVIMVGAIVVHLRRDERQPIIINLVPLALAVTVAVGRGIDVVGQSGRYSKTGTSSTSSVDMMPRAPTNRGQCLGCEPWPGDPSPGRGMRCRGMDTQSSLSLSGRQGSGKAPTTTASTTTNRQRSPSGSQEPTTIAVQQPGTDSERRAGTPST